MTKSKQKSTTNKKKAPNRKVLEGLAHVTATFNNTLITITDLRGNALCQSSSGAAGFKGARKSTPYAAKMAAEKLAEKVHTEFGMRSVSVLLKGPGPGRENAIRGLMAFLAVGSTRDRTPIPHNGTRPSKTRRV